MLAVLALVACGDDNPTGGSGAGGAENPGGSGQGGQGGIASGPGGNGTGGAPQAGEAPGGNAEGGAAEGGNAQGGNSQGGSAQGGNAEGGQGGGSGTLSIADLCQTACGYLAGCFGGNPADCTVECSTDLGDCSPTQLGEVDSCNQAAMNDCDLVNDFTDCLEAVACAGGA